MKIYRNMSKFKDYIFMFDNIAINLTLLEYSNVWVRNSIPIKNVERFNSEWTNVRFSDIDNRCLDKLTIQEIAQLKLNDIQEK